MATAAKNVQDLYQYKVEHVGSPIVRRVIQNVLPVIAEDLSLDVIADEVGISKFTLCRIFQSEFGITPIRWLWVTRAHLSAVFLRQSTRWSLTEIAFACGFTSSAHFSRLFKEIIGMSPSSYRQLYRKSPSLVGDDLQMFSSSDDCIREAAIIALNANKFAQRATLEACL